jgi:adenylate cyclase
VWTVPSPPPSTGPSEADAARDDASPVAPQAVDRPAGPAAHNPTAHGDVQNAGADADAEAEAEAELDAERVEALIRVRAVLLGLGCTDEEIDKAVEEDVVDLLMVDRLLVPTGQRLTQADVSNLTDLPTDDARRFWRALGFLDVGDDDPAFTDLDLEAVRTFQHMVALGLADTATAVQMARVIGSSMARIAEAEAAAGSTPVLFASSGDGIIDADRFATRAAESIPAMARLLEYVWRRHLQAATRRAMLVRSRGLADVTRPVVAVGFADMVGFTVLSQHLGDAELTAIVARFEELAHDTVVALGGRVVKMIGDEVMFVVQSPVNAARIGLSLAEAYADDDLLSDVRVALAVGPTLLQEGDYYGPVVNLASRLVAVAHPGTVLVSDELRAALVEEGAEEFETRPLRPRNLKDIGRVQAWKLIRAGSEPGADRRRNVRWERLTEVLSQLDEVRDRGERLVVERSALRRGEHQAAGRPATENDESVAGQASGGDGVATEGEPAFEG